MISFDEPPNRSTFRDQLDAHVGEHIKLTWIGQSSVKTRMLLEIGDDYIVTQSPRGVSSYTQFSSISFVQFCETKDY